MWFALCSALTALATGFGLLPKESIGLGQLLEHRLFSRGARNNPEFRPR